MKIIEWYLGKTVIESTFLALLILTGMQSFISFIGELHDIGTLNYGVLQALVYVPMVLPSYLYQFFPIAALIGVLMGLGRLASRSELIVMRAAGVSMSQVMWAVAKSMLVVLIVVTLIGEWFAPHWQYNAEKRKGLAMTGSSALVTTEGAWVRDTNNFIHINQILPGGMLQGITRYQFANHKLILASYAESGVFTQGKWQFKNVMQSNFDKDRVTSQKDAQQIWDVTFNPRLLALASIDPAQQTLPRLFHYLQYLKQNNQSTNRLEFVFWQRLLQPIATLIMMLLGVPFIFGPLRSATMGFRIVIGTVMGFAFYMLNEFFGPLSMVYQLPPPFAAALPTVLFAVGGGILLWRSR